MINRFNIFIILSLCITLSGCRSTRDITYFQEGNSSKGSDKVVFPNFDKDKNAKFSTFEAIIAPSDILSIYVSSLSPEATAFFNTVNTPDQSSNAFTTRTSVGYLVDINGMIEMPLIGRIKLGGLSTRLAIDTLTHRLENYLQNPTVRIYFENFRITILGEVARPGIFTVTNEKISLTEAIGMAGDLSIYGDRKSVMLIREENGEKKFITLDLTSRDLFQSPYYYLHSNDVLYVEPVKARIAQSDNFYRVAPFIMSTITLIAVLITRFGTNN
ncbi:MAG: polysaccharide biosynthesis/export family protein [Bacteroidota bacterium]